MGTSSFGIHFLDRVHNVAVECDEEEYHYTYLSHFDAALIESSAEQRSIEEFKDMIEVLEDLLQTRNTYCPPYKACLLYTSRCV